MTLSDKELDRRIAGQQKMISQAKPGSWTAVKLEAALGELLAQRAKPRNNRSQWERGSI